MSDFEKFTAEIIEQLELAAAPISLVGINDPRIEGVFPGVVKNRGDSIKEPWEHLEEDDPLPTMRRKTISLVAGLCLTPFFDVIDVVAVSPSGMGGGSVHIELGKMTDIDMILGESMIQHGQVGTSFDGARMWAGVASLAPDFGLSCFAREVPATPPPYCAAPWVVGHEIFVQGLTQEAAQTLSALDL